MALSRSGSHAAGVSAFGGDPAFPNSGAGGNRFVACLNDAPEVPVGKDPLWHVAAGADN